MEQQSEHAPILIDGTAVEKVEMVQCLLNLWRLNKCLDP